MNKNYKIVEIYNDGEILEVWGEEVWGELKDICNNIIENNKVDCINSNGEYGLDIWKEFYSYINCGEDYGFVSNGEEGSIVVLDSNNVWYSKVDNYKEWSDEEWSEWNDFGNGY